MTMNSRKLNKLERKLRRKAMREAALREAESRPAAEEVIEPAQMQQAAPINQPSEVPAKPEASRIQKRIQRVLETSAAELEQSELAILDELLEAAREGVALHKAEAHERNAAQLRGQPITTRWQVAPGVFDKLAGRMLRIIEIKLRHRQAQTPIRLAG